MPADFPITTRLKSKDQATRGVKVAARVIETRLGRAVGRIGRLTGRANRLLGGMVKRVGLLGGAAAVGGVATLAHTHARAADDLAKSARRAGITAQAYAELRHAADLAGVSGGDFGKAIEKATRSVGEAKAGTGALYTLLRKTSPAFLRQVQATESSTDALNLLIRAMGQIEDPGRRAAFAAAAFGRSGHKMTLLVQDGTEALADQRAEFRRLHGVVDGQALKDAEAFVDAQARMKQALSGVKFAIGSKLLPVLQPTLDKMTSWITANRELIATKIGEVIGKIGDALKGIKWDKALTGIGDFLEAIGKGWKAIGGFKGIAVALGAVLAGNVVVGISSLVTALGVLKAAILANPLGAAFTVAALAVGAAVVTIREHWQPLRQIFRAFWNDTKAAAGKVGQWLSDKFTAASDAIRGAWEKTKTFFTETFDWIAGLFKKLWVKVEPIISKITKGVRLVKEGISTVAGAVGLGDDAPPQTIAGGGNVSPRDMPRLPLAAAQPPATTTGLASVGGGGRVNVGGGIQVSFTNAPAGMSVEQVTSTSPDVPVSANVGRRMMSVGAL